MIVRRSEVMASICTKVGIRKRKKPDNPYFSKEELVKLNSWIDTMTELQRSRRSAQDVREPSDQSN